MAENNSLLRRILKRKLILGATVGAAAFFMIMGVIFWGGFNTAMEATNTLTFCTSCHEMKNNVYVEYEKTIHFTNRSGVRATCSDCHVPKDWTHKVVRKIQASGELFHKAMGSIDTPEKFNEKRLELAKRVWVTMKETDSRECRNCHDFSTMNPINQQPRASKQHYNAMQNGQTCIDCHKGIAHSKIHDKLTDQELETLEAPNPNIKRAIAPQWVAFFESGTKTVVNPVAADAGPNPDPVAEAAPAPTAEQTPPAIKTKPVESTPVTTIAASPAAVENPASVKPVEAKAIASKTTATSSGKLDADIDWSKASTTKIGIFYPGQSSMEWVLNGRDHGGARPLNAGDRCFSCHAAEIDSIGQKIVSGQKLEPNPIEGKRGSIPITVQATHDNDYLYMRFTWPDTKHAPVTFVEDGKMDKVNASKIALMLATDDIKYADRSGCWITCHNDMKGMPDAPPADVLAGNIHASSYNWTTGVSKYIPESRTSIEIKGNDGAPRGGWDKLKSTGEIKTELNAGHYMDIARFKLGAKVSEDGYVLADRHMSGGKAAQFSGGLVSGKWVVIMKRKLVGEQAGDLSLSTDRLYNIGFAVHDDYSQGRYHHVSLGYKLGFDNKDAEINAIRQ